MAKQSQIIIVLVISGRPDVGLCLRLSYDVLYKCKTVYFRERQESSKIVIFKLQFLWKNVFAST